MKVYVYLDTNGKLNTRNKEFIDVDFPQFWSVNEAFVEKVWPIDTESKSDVLSMCKSFQALRLKTEEVLVLLRSINVSQEDLKKYASSI